MDNQSNNPRADLRNAIYNYFLAKIAEDESFMPDSIHRDIVAVADEVPQNLVFKSVSDVNEYKALYSNNSRWFEFVDVDDINVNDFVFITSSGLFQVTKIESN